MRHHTTTLIRASAILAAGIAAVQAAPPPSGAGSGADPTDMLAHNEQGRTVGQRPPTGEAGTPVPGAGFTVERLIGGLGKIKAASGPNANGFDSGVYVVRADAGVVEKVDASGYSTRFADLGGPASPAAAPSFDIGGAWGGSLMIADSTSGGVRLDASGRRSTLVMDATRSMPVGAVAADPYGGFGGRLLFTNSAGLGLFWAEPGRPAHLLATGIGAAPHAMAFAPPEAPSFGGAVFIVSPSSGRIHAVGAAHVSGDPAPLFADLSSRGVRPTGLAFSTGGAFGSDMLYIADGAHGAVIGLTPGGLPTAPILTGLDSDASVLIPRVGAFAGTMLVVSDGSVWVVRPRCTSDFDASGEVDANDVSLYTNSWLRDLTTGTVAADFDGSGETDNNDLSDYFNAWFTQLTHGC